MTNEEREELIEKITQNIVVACGYRMTPTRWLIVQSHARAALAVAEPVIREQCARMAEKRACMIDCCEATGVKIAAAIREAGKDD